MVTTQLPQPASPQERFAPKSEHRHTSEGRGLQEIIERVLSSRADPLGFTVELEGDRHSGCTNTARSDDPQRDVPPNCWGAAFIAPDEATN